MEDIKSIIADNIVCLRHKHGLTQTALAEKLSYSDKAVSKWERGESVPDITVLKSIADLFGVTVDYLITAEHSCVENSENEKNVTVSEKWLRKRKMIVGMGVMLVWLLAVLAFIFIDVAFPDVKGHWLAFIVALPVSALVWLVLNSLWFNKRINFLIISIMVWSLILSVHLLLVVLGYNLWQLYLAGIPGQLIIILWSKMGVKKF